MSYILNRSLIVVVIVVSSFLVFGCSSPSEEDPQQKANDAVAKANKSIGEHNRLFEQSRDTYNEVKTKLEDGEDPSEQKARITEAKDSLEDARSSLEEARKPLGDVRGLDVDPAVKNYAALLSEAMGAQLSAESKEIRFYEILEDDPTLKDNREQALDLLSEVGDEYSRSDDLYGQARDLADSKPKVIALPGGASNAASESENTTESTS